VIYRMVRFPMILNDFTVTPLFDAAYLRKGTVCDRGTVTVEGSRDLHVLYTAVSFRMTLSDLERLSKIFIDMKHRAASVDS